jgi:hypothetical protein
MNEPLNSSRPGISFSGKTYNTHPQWYNQPLRLTKEQKQDPLPVLDEFFQNYHLNEVRQTLWEWLSEVLSSPRSISNDYHDRNNHIFFYEKIESAIEAVFIIKKKIHKHRRRREKWKLKQATLPGLDKATKIKEVNSSDKLIPALETEENADLFNKPKQLIEYVDNDPIYVINEIFKKESLDFLRDQLRDWLFVAVSADTAIYEDGEQRKQLLSFQDQLLVLVEALFVINTENIDKESLKDADKPRLFSQDQIANPLQVITTFFEKFPIIYCIRELDDWQEAGIAYAGDYPGNMSELGVLLTHRIALCLVKAAHRLLMK